MGGTFGRGDWVSGWKDRCVRAQLNFQPLLFGRLRVISLLRVRSETLQINSAAYEHRAL